MFAVIYRWNVIPGREAQFEEGWREGTDAIRREFNGWGSRLHDAGTGQFIAYAQWPDEATWKAALAKRMYHSNEAARRKYRDAFYPGTFETLHAMPVTADLLDLRRG
ncbi:MAG: antibiotic biosynthesis monooxygenase [Hyphomonadaceae bacterium]